MKYITAEGPSSELATGFLGAVCERPTGHTYPAAHEPVKFMSIDEARNYLASAFAESMAAMPPVEPVQQGFTDADRLSWLLERPCRMPIESTRGYIVQEWVGHTTGRGETARDAIDAAMKAQKAQKAKESK